VFDSLHPGCPEGTTRRAMDRTPEHRSVVRPDSPRLRGGRTGWQRRPSTALAARSAAVAPDRSRAGRRLPGPGAGRPRCGGTVRRLTWTPPEPRAHRVVHTMWTTVWTSHDVGARRCR
jgi:hypothetical protein